MLESLVIYSCPVIVGGDISVHVEDPSNTLTAWYLDLLSSMRLQQHVTHISAGLLDHVITRTNLQLISLTWIHQDSFPTTVSSLATAVDHSSPVHRRSLV